MLATLLVTLGADSALAIFPEDCRQIQEGYCKNVMWPWPDFCPDRAHARAPFNVMVRNGWRRQNLLGPHHFSPETGELNTAGELKVHWVMTQAPQAYRQIFIERSLEQDVTDQRIVAARSYAEQVALNGEVPVVQDTHLISEGRPASMIDFINVAFQESMPPPVLPASSLGEGGAEQ